MRNSPRTTAVLLVLTLVSGTLTGVAAAADVLPAEWRPFAVIGGIFGTSLSGALAAFSPQLRAPRGE